MTGAAGIQRKSVKTNMEIHDNISDQIFSPNPIKIEFFLFQLFWVTKLNHNFTKTVNTILLSRKNKFLQNAVGRICGISRAQWKIHHPLQIDFQFNFENDDILLSKISFVILKHTKYFNLLNRTYKLVCTNIHEKTKPGSNFTRYKFQ